MLDQYDTSANMSEMGDPNISLRMLYLTVVVVALFVTCGFISAMHERGFPEIEYPWNTWNTDLTNYTSVRKRRASRNAVSRRHSDIPRYYRLPDDSVLEKLSDLTLSKVFWFYINQIQRLCRNSSSISSVGIGREICVDDLHTSGKRHNCLVYSVGHDLNFEFERQMRRMYMCDVRVLQRSGLTKTATSEEILSIGNDAMDVPEGIVVHQILDTDSSDGERSRSKLFSRGVRRAISREDKSIDVLKIDAEGEEWTLLPVLLNSGLLKHVKQILLDIHFGWGEVSKCKNLKILRTLYDEGFRVSLLKHKLTTGSLTFLPNLTFTTVNEMLLVNIRMKTRHKHF